MRLHCTLLGRTRNRIRQRHKTMKVCLGRDSRTRSSRWHRDHDPTPSRSAFFLASQFRVLLGNVLKLISYVPRPTLWTLLAVPAASAQPSPYVRPPGTSFDFALHFVDLDFVIAGFPQSGTSSLVHYLSQHPEIYISPHFEDNMFWRANYSATSFRRWRKDYPHRGDTVKQRKTFGTEKVRFLGLKDPLLGFTPEAMQLVGERVKKGCKLIFLIRDPLEMLISWLQGGASWLTPWNTALHLGAGFLLEHLQIAKAFFKRGQTPSPDVEEEIEKNVLYVPTHQLLVNTNETLNRVCEFLGAKAWDFDTRKKLHVAMTTSITKPDASTSPAQDPERGVSLSTAPVPSLSRGPTAFHLPLPGYHLDVCGLHVFPFLQAAFEGQQNLLVNLFEDAATKHKIRFAEPFFADDADGVPKQCRNYRKRRKKVDERRLISARGGARGTKKDRRGRTTFEPLHYRLPQCEPALANVAIEPLRNRVLQLEVQEAEQHDEIVPFLYENVPRARRPDVCNSLNEIRSYIPDAILKQLDCSLGRRIETSSTHHVDEDHGERNGGQVLDQAEFLCARCCIEFDPACWDDSSVPKLPKCCIKRLSTFLSVVSYLLRVEVCGQDMGCSGRARRSFVTMENLN